LFSKKNFSLLARGWPVCGGGAAGRGFSLGGTPPQKDGFIWPPPPPARGLKGEKNNLKPPGGRRNFFRGGGPGQRGGEPQKHKEWSWLFFVGTGGARGGKNPGFPNFSRPLNFLFPPFFRGGGGPPIGKGFIRGGKPSRAQKNRADPRRGAGKGEKNPPQIFNFFPFFFKKKKKNRFPKKRGEKKTPKNFFFFIFPPRGGAVLFWKNKGPGAFLGGFPKKRKNFLGGLAFSRTDCQTIPPPCQKNFKG